MKIPFGKPLIDSKERMAVQKVLSGNILVHGPKIIEFEKKFSEFTKSNYSLGVSSCTSGMHLFYYALGIKKGDEIILPSQTHVATAMAIEAVGAKPIFIDSDVKTGNIDVDLIEKKISKKTKVITVVHYLGVPVNMDKVLKIAKKYKLLILEDCALSVGSFYKNKHTGLLGDAGVFSFYPVKHMTTSEGGMIITKNKTIYNKLKLKRAFGVNKNFTQRKLPGNYDVIEKGLNYRMSEIEATIGIEQIKKLNLFIKKRKFNHDFLVKKLSYNNNFRLLSPNFDKSIYWSHYCFTIILNKKILKKRRLFIKKLNKLGIGTSIYYPHPVPLMTYFKKKYQFKKNQFKNSSIFSYNSIMFPIGPHLKIKHLEYMAKKINEIVK